MKTMYYYWITNIKNIGYVKTSKLLNSFGSIKSIYEADVNEYCKLGYLSKTDIDNIVESKDMKRCQNEIEQIKNKGINVIDIESEQYPYLLKQINNPPSIIYTKGNVDISTPSIAIVGSRKCSEYGYSMAYEIAKELTKKGVLVVSGLANGIDTAAHKGALSAGETVAVLGNGVDIAYPPGNILLQRQIEDKGTLVSEYKPGTRPNPGFFPARNRIISGLSLGVLIVEAANRSGSLITADLALEQNRDVFAIPGNIWSDMSKGSNRIIQMGAKLVMRADDIIEEIENYLPQNIHVNPNNEIANKLKLLAQDEIMVYDYLSPEPLYIDDVSKDTGILISSLQSIITSLEIKGLIKRLPGQRLVRIE